MINLETPNHSYPTTRYPSPSYPAPSRINAVRITRETGLWLLRKMREIRQFQERILPIYPTDVMVTPLHLHIGEEAVPAGVCAHLKREDTLFFTHRSHGPALAKGMEMKVLAAELYGRTTGCSRSRGGSMHLLDKGNGMLGSSAIVGGGIALGVGSALAARLRGEDRISVSYFGDGATDAGVFWESLNFASLKALPVLFVCENNGLSNTMRQAEHLFVELTSVSERFMPSFLADGTDVLSVHAAAGDAIGYVRANGKPAFLECKTKRWMKHQGVEKDDLACNPVDPEEDCPIRKLDRKLLQEGLMTGKEREAMIEEIERKISEALEFALSSPFPKASDLGTGIGG